MRRWNLLITKLSGVCLCAITVFTRQITNSACIWWMYQPKEPKALSHQEKMLSFYSNYK